jgi:CBS domain-containing protein
MDVQTLMTRDVVAVSPETSLKDVARLLIERRISGVPVRDADGSVLGVVSETDIVRTEEGYAEKPSGVLSWLLDRGGDVSRVEAATAGEAMSTPAVVAHPAWQAASAARVMTEQKVNRLPVVVDGQLVGIVTRSDLLRAFARPDAEIEREILSDVLVRTLWISPDRIELEVDDGRVILRGEVETQTEAELAAAYVRRVPGVVHVDTSELHSLEDDLERRRSAVPHADARR